MAFDTIEASPEDGRPVAFYEFTFGSTTWRYTSADQDITISSVVWSRAAISDDGVRQTGESTTDALQLTAPSWIGPAQVFMEGSPSQPILLTIRTKHEGDAEIRVVYSGEISQINFPLPGSCRITCETTSASMQREGLRLGWQRSCPYTLYDPLTCRLDRTAWGVNFTVTAINGEVVTVLAAVAKTRSYFSLGFIQWAHPTRGVEYLQLENMADIGVGPPAPPSTTVMLHLLDLPGSLYVGATGTAYPGCSFTPASCQAFSNFDNYGGYTTIPGKSPFDGNPVFY